MINILRRPMDLPRGFYIRVIVIAIALALSVLLGYLTPVLQYGFAGMGVEVVIGGIILVMFVIVALRYIELGVMAIVLVAFFVRFTLPTGTQTRIPASMILAVLMFAVWIISLSMKRKMNLVPSRTNLPLIMFILAAIISLPMSWLSWRPEFWTWTTMTRFQIAQFGGLGAMVFLPVTFLLALNVLRDVKWAKWLLVAMIVIAVPELLQRLAGKYLQFGGVGVSGPGLYHLWLIALLYAQLLFNRNLSTPLRLFYGIVILAWMYWGFVRNLQWTSVWMPPIVAMLFLTFLKSKRAFGFLVAVGLLLFLLNLGYFYDNVFVDAQTNDFNRFWLWPTIVFDLTFRRAGILLGAGPAGYTPYFMTYYPGQAMSAHNNYVDIIAETGIIGSAFFLWFIFAVLRTGWNLSSKLQDDFLLAFSNGVLAGFIGMLAAMMLDDWFIPFAYNNGLPGFDMNVYAWILLGMMVGLEQLVASKKLKARTAT